MAPKKAKKKSTKRSKKKGGSKGEDRQNCAESNCFTPVISTDIQSQEEWVTLNMHLMNWDFMDFTMKVKTDTHVFSLKTLLARKHGRIADLVVCRDSFEERNELVDDMKMLSEYGFEGGPKDEAPVVRLFYNFNVGDDADAPDPLLLCD